MQPSLTQRPDLGGRSSYVKIGSWTISPGILLFNIYRGAIPLLFGVIN